MTSNESIQLNIAKIKSEASSIEETGCFCKVVALPPNSLKD